MKLNPDTLDETLVKFLASWPVSRIHTMSVSEYADLSNHDSFCYWLEYGTKNLGQIGDNSLTKFEFWKPKGQVEFKDDRFITDGTYAWNANRGATRQQAFDDVRRNILQIISFAQSQNFEAIDNVPFHQIGKWKIAFIYSNKTLLPVYSKRALIAIAKGLGETFPYQTKVSTLQRFLLQHKPDNESVDEYAYSQYGRFAKKSKPNYYIIGSKYGSSNSVIADFISNSCVAIGFMSHIDFTPYIGAEDDEVYKFVDENWTEESPGKHKIHRYFKLLSEIKAGDIIAVKSHGTHNQLTIIAYAKVVERNGSVYEHNENELGHHIHVEFLDTGLYKNFGLTYAETIHKLTPGKDKDKFYKVFGWYTQAPGIDDEETDEEEGSDGQDKQGEDGEYNEKTEGTVPRGSVAAAYVTLVHNRIQNRFIKYLKKEYPKDKPTGEKRRIDAKRENATGVFIYEIKPSLSVYSCIREAIGQLLDYSHSNTTSKKKHLIVVGPSQPDDRDIAFIESIRTNVKFPFSYLAFDEKELTAEEY